jgi:RES domain-containing protein
MLIYRICRSEFARYLKASGFAGRWNRDGQWVLYASATRSLAALEQLANRSGLVLSVSYSVMVIEVPDVVDSLRSAVSDVLFSVLPEGLPADWQRFSGYGRLQELGTDWYRRSESLLLRVPSVLIPQENNYLINTQHVDFCSLVRLVGVENFNWDNRLG